MTSEWKKKALSEIAFFTTGKLNSNASVENGKYPFFTCSPETLWIDEYAFDQDAILLAGNNAEGNFNIKFYSGKFNAYQRTYVFSAKDNCILRFLYYSLKLCLDNFKIISQGTATKFLTAKILNSFEIMLPNLETQQKIAVILSAIDDKIELNNAINKNLEEQAQAIFKSWFVDFEPFGGVMPDDWKIDKLGSFVEIKRGGSPRPIQDYLSDNGYRWLKISDVTSINSPYILEIKEHIKESGIKKTVMLKQGVLVLSNSATPGIPKILDVDSCIHDGWLYFQKSLLSNEYLYLLFKMIRNDLVMLGNGSVFTNLKTDILRQFEITMPTEKILLDFQAVIKPMFDTMRNIARENQRLASLRDTLLPKLMNGEIDISAVKV